MEIKDRNLNKDYLVNLEDNNSQDEDTILKNICMIQVMSTDIKSNLFLNYDNQNIILYESYFS